MEEKNIERKLKYLILGYRKHTGTTQRTLAKKLGVPLNIETSLETGAYKYPTDRLMAKIKELLSEFDTSELIEIGRGYWIKDRLGPEFKYFIKGLKPVKGIDTNKLKSLTDEECYKFIGNTDFDIVEIVEAGRDI